MITNSHFPFLAPRYQAAFAFAAMQRGDMAPMRLLLAGATRGEAGARRALQHLTAVKARHDARVRVETGSLAVLLAPVLSKGATELVKLFTRARQGDSRAAEVYTEKVQAAREGDAETLAALAEVKLASRAVKRDEAAAKKQSQQALAVERAKAAGWLP